MSGTDLNPPESFISNMMKSGVHIQAFETQSDGSPLEDDEAVRAGQDQFVGTRYISWSEGGLGLFVMDTNLNVNGVMRAEVTSGFLAIDLPFHGRNHAMRDWLVNDRKVVIGGVRNQPTLGALTLDYMRTGDQLEARLDKRNVKGAFLLINDSMLATHVGKSTAELPSLIAEFVAGERAESAYVELPVKAVWRLGELLGGRVGGEFAPLYYQACASEIAWIVLNHLGSTPAQIHHDKISLHQRVGVERVRSVIEEDPARRTNVHELARLSGMNRTTLRELFKEVHGKTISTYRTEIIMDRALRMVRDSEISIAELAFLLGYSDTANFSVAFKRFYGFSPGWFRNRSISS